MLAKESEDLILTKMFYMHVLKKEEASTKNCTTIVVSLKFKLRQNFWIYMIVSLLTFWKFQSSSNLISILFFIYF